MSFTGKEDGVKGQVFAKTRSRLEKELSESSSIMLQRARLGDPRSIVCMLA